MTQPAMKQHTQVVAIVQNLIAVLATATGALIGVVRIERVTRQQLQFYTWDAIVLAVGDELHASL